MTQEEKTRAYDKVRKKIAIRFGSNVADEFFAEFEGSKDEEIRKALLEMVHDTTGDELWVDYNVHKEEALAWLEKQELKSNPYSGVSFNYNGNTWGMCARDNGVDISCDKHLIKHLEKQDKQKPEENNGNLGGISPNSAWTEEDDDYYDTIVTKLKVIGDDSGLTLDQIDFLDKYRPQQKPIDQQMYWTEEEIEPIISDYLCGREHYGGMIGRLCHLKPKQKQTEWGEDDKAFLDDILCKLEHDLILNKDEKDWLKSLTPQNRWKPSELQLGCLSDAIEHYNSLGYPASKLKELLDDLKELKGEV